ncbi:GNAT family N-acetyltransferase [Streptomyces sp. NPDC050263]|uniref:GNAT family N-acetyltransferase n=1 Tax=Streptomyces sp. NPDC050263 TaxID=3155037 RepID=UPI0034392E94
MSPEDPQDSHGPDGTDGWQLTQDLDGFLDRAGGFLASRPDLHTVALTVTAGLRRRGLRLYGDEAPFFGTLTGADGSVRAAFFRTPPYPINVTPLTEEDAEALAARLVSAGHRLSGVAAESDTASAFAAAWRRRTGAETVGDPERQRLYRLDQLVFPTPRPPGAPRIATDADRAQLVRWYREFCVSVGEDGLQDAGAWAADRIAYGGITLWETPDGTPVSMAGVTPEVVGQVRVFPVYTPAELRGHGYAGAATAEVSRAAPAAGATEVLLFTDLANPTSNALYQRIGYRPVADFAVYEFVMRDL